MRIDFLGIDTDTMDQLEFQELIPGIKLPAMPVPLAGILDKLPVLPGFTIKDPAGNVIGKGMKIPNPFENAPANGAETLAGGQSYQDYAHASSYAPDLYEEPAALGNMSAAEMEFAELELGVSAESVVDVDLDEEQLEI